MKNRWISKTELNARLKTLLELFQISMEYYILQQYASLLRQAVLLKKMYGQKRTRKTD